MSDFDDRELRDSLQRLAGHPGDETAAYAVVQQRVRVAKRRRAVVGGSGLIALCIAGFVLVGFDRRSGETLTPATDGITVPTDVAMLPDVAESTDDATTVDPPARSPEPPTSVPTVTNAPTTHAVDNSVPRPTVGAVATNGGGDLTPPIAEDTPGSETGTTAPDTGESSDTAGNPTRAETQTFTSAHGSLTVSMRDGRQRPPVRIVGLQLDPLGPGRRCRVQHVHVAELDDAQDALALGGGCDAAQLGSDRTISRRRVGAVTGAHCARR